MTQRNKILTSFGTLYSSKEFMTHRKWNVQGKDKVWSYSLLLWSLWLSQASSKRPSEELTPEDQKEKGISHICLHLTLNVKLLTDLRYNGEKIGDWKGLYVCNLKCRLNINIKTGSNTQETNYSIVITSDVILVQFY